MTSLEEKLAVLSVEDRQRFEQVLGPGWRDRPARPLGEIMDEMSRNAEARGLTPEILEQLLNNDD